MYNYLHIISLYVDTFCKGFVIYLLWDLSWVYKSFIIWSCSIFLIMWANYIGQIFWSHVQFVHAKTKIEHGTFVLLNVFFYFLFFSCYIIGFTFALMPKLMCQSWHQCENCHIMSISTTMMKFLYFLQVDS
jgi:hypothetical protein